MSNRPHAINIYAFGNGDPLEVFTVGNLRGQYIRKYLEDLGATTVVEESQYFDRDYLDEFAQFYSVSTRGYSNRCRRLHFFSGSPFGREQLRNALGGGSRTIRRLSRSYLGFIVLRPIHSAPFGRTVLKWYPDNKPAEPRIYDPARSYTSHLAGIALSVDGIAWQQQDQGVGACATIALWSLLHSSALDDGHSIPTTAEITQRAHMTDAAGIPRLYPSKGLSIWQILAAIKSCGLAPVWITGELPEDRFSKLRFCSMYATLIRSGFPALICGELEGAGGHAVCGVAFRESAVTNPTAPVVLQDEDFEFMYMHDDNIGPNVRVQIQVDPAGFAAIKPKAPSSSGGVITKYPRLIPNGILAAVPHELRTEPQSLQKQALDMGANIWAGLSHAGVARDVVVTTRFIKLSDYTSRELERVIGHDQKILARVRLALSERVRPMSLYLGVVRLGVAGAPVLDVLLDTTDSDVNLSSYCHIYFDAQIGKLVELLRQSGIENFGMPIAGAD